MSQIKGHLTDDEVAVAQQRVILQGITAQVRLSLTESVFLVGFALLLGASNSVIGIFAAIPFLAQFLQIPSIYLIHRFGSRKKLNFITQLGNRLAVLIMVLIPYISMTTQGLILLLLSVSIQAIFTSLGTSSWNSWLRDLVPQHQLGAFFSRRMSIMGAVSVATSLGGGVLVALWLSWSPADLARAYSILFFIAFISGMIAVYFTSRTPEPLLFFYDKKPAFLELVAKPFKDGNFRNVMWFSLVWVLSANLAAPFFSVYLLVRLGFGLQIAAAFVALTQMTSIIFLRFWGRLSDRFSNKSILQVTVPIYIIGTLLWTFSSVAESVSLLLPLLIIIHVMTGFASAGVNLAGSNIDLKIAPRGEAHSYLAARGTINAAAGGVASVIGGLLADFFASRELYFSFTWVDPGGVTVIHTYHIQGLDFVFLLSVIIGVFALHRLALVNEIGEVEERVVVEAIIAETRRNVKTLSTVDGLRQTFHLPLSKRRRRTRSTERINEENLEGLE
ncbi:MAG: MFS transporter [Candidatus Thorarchaeota archaeon]|nr:MAG: MFS transporter [Candidatus Thorarchaeota archaeon]